MSFIKFKLYYKNPQRLMAWYNKSIQQSYLNKFASPINPLNILFNQNIIPDLKSKHHQLITQLTNNFSLILQPIIQFALLIPSTYQTNDRKFRYPLSAVVFLQNLVIVYDMSLDQTYEYLSIIFRQYFTNQKQSLTDTIIPAYLTRLIDPLFFKYPTQVNKYFNNHQNIINQLLKYLQFDSITKIINLLLNNQKKTQQKLALQIKQSIITNINLLLTQSTQNDWQIQNSLHIFIQIIQHQSIETLKPIINQTLSTITHSCIRLFNHHRTSVSLMALQVLKHLLISKSFSSITLDELWREQQKDFQKIIDKKKVPKIQLRSLIQLTINTLKNQVKIDEIEQILINRKVMCFLLNFIQVWPQNNLVICKIEILIDQIFRLKLKNLMTHLFVECQIIEGTINQMKTINSYNFGFLVKIARSYVQMRLQTPQINKRIQNNFENWKEFSKSILNPYIQLISKKNWEQLEQNIINQYLLSKGEIITKEKQIDVEYSIKSFLKPINNSILTESKQRQITLKTLQKYQQENNISIITLSDRLKEQDIQTNHYLSEISNQPIKLNQSINLPTFHPKDSFQLYMTQTKAQITSQPKKQLVKSRSTSRLKSTEAKVNKWKTNYQNNLSPKSTKNQSQSNQRIKIIKVNTKNISKKHQNYQTRQINSKQDSKLKKWLHLIKNSKLIDNQ